MPVNYCATCGLNIASGARFCSGCGAVAVAPERTRAAVVNAPPPSPYAPAQTQTRVAESSEVERVVFTINPTLLFVKIGYAVTALGSIALIILLALMSAPTLISVILALALLLVPAFYHVKLRAIRYTLTDSKIEIDRGLLARTTRNIPLRNIQDVTVSATLAQRLLGVGNLLIDNASEANGKTILGNIRQPRRHADLLLRELRRWH